MENKLRNTGILTKKEGPIPLFYTLTGMFIGVNAIALSGMISNGLKAGTCEFMFVVSVVMFLILLISRKITHTYTPKKEND